MARKPNPLIPVEPVMITIDEEEYKQLKRDATMLKAVKDAGVMTTPVWKMAQTIYNFEYRGDQI